MSVMNLYFIPLAWRMTILSLIMDAFHLYFLEFDLLPKSTCYPRGQRIDLARVSDFFFFNVLNLSVLNLANSYNRILFENLFGLLRLKQTTWKPTSGSLLRRLNALDVIHSVRVVGLLFFLQVHHFVKAFQLFGEVLCSLLHYHSSEWLFICQQHVATLVHDSVILQVFKLTPSHFYPWLLHYLDNTGCLLDLVSENAWQWRPIVFRIIIEILLFKFFVTSIWCLDQRTAGLTAWSRRRLWLFVTWKLGVIDVVNFGFKTYVVQNFLPSVSNV